jgi:hypothetical protein
MEVAEGKLKTKLIQLNITTNRTKSIVDNGQAEAIERHQKTLRTVINEVDQLRIEIKAHKITEQVKDEDLDAWNANIVTQIAKNANIVTQIANCKIANSKCGNLERVAQ